MTATLPVGLINPTAIEQHDFDDSDISNDDAIRQFWKGLLPLLHVDAIHD